MREEQRRRRLAVTVQLVLAGEAEVVERVSCAAHASPLQQGLGRGRRAVRELGGFAVAFLACDGGRRL